MKQLALLFVLLVGVMALAAWLDRGEVKEFIMDTVNTAQEEQPQPSTATVTIGQTSVAVEIADTPEKTEKGLSERESLGDNEGMLFVVWENSRPPFWMKGMKFSIDIIWIDDSTVVGFVENAPPQGNTPDSALSKYRPPQPIDYVLEVKAGFVKEHSITVGTSVQLPEGLE